MKLEIKSESQCRQISLSHWKIHHGLHFICLFMYVVNKAFCLLYHLFWIFDTCYLLTLGIFWQILFTIEFYEFLRMICLYLQIKDVLLWCL